MRVKWVLIGFSIVYLCTALSFVPADEFLPGPIADVFSIFSGVTGGR